MNTPVNFEIAKLLKEKGFNDESYSIVLKYLGKPKEFFFANIHFKYNEPIQYCDDIRFTNLINGKWSNKFSDTHLLDTNPIEIYSAPIIAQVIMWLYETHGFFVTVTIPYSEFGKFSAEIWGKESDNIKILLVDGMSVFNTINQAYEEGIIESLKLI